MVNRTIDPIKKFISKEHLNNSESFDDGSSERYETVKQYAKEFIDGMSKEQRARYKIMLDSGIEAGKNVAKIYEIDPEEFMKAVKEYVNHK